MKIDKYNLNETINGNKSLYDNESSDKTNMDKDRTKKGWLLQEILC